MRDLSKQRQTIFGEGKGNCFATCIACLIGVPVEDVPNFVVETEGNWFANAVNWLSDRGWGVMYIYNPNGRVADSVALYSTYPYIQTAKSPRGDFLHCAIYQHGTLVHDPHPSDLGVEGTITDYLLVYPLVTQ